MMTTAGENPINWHHPIPGDPRVVQGEIDRLGEVLRCCRDAIAALRSLDVSTWQGAAAEAFDSVRRRQLVQWYTVEDALVAAIDAYGNHLGALLTLQPLGREAALRAQRSAQDRQSASADILRWRTQLDGEKQNAASLLGRATDQLRSIERLVGTIVPEPAAPKEPTAPTPVEAAATPLQDGSETTQRIDHDQITEWSPAERFRFTTELCHALLDGVYVSAEQLGSAGTTP